MSYNVGPYGDAFTGSLVNVWESFSAGFVVVVAAIILLIVGFLIASLLSHAARKLVERIKIDTLITRVSALQKAQDAGWKIKPSYLVGWTVKWFFIVVTLLAVSEYLGLSAVAEFLGKIVAYIPQVVVAIVLMVIGFVVGQFVHDVTKRSLEQPDMPGDAQKVVPLVAKWAIIIIAGLAAVSQLGVGQEMINTFFTGVIFAIALALGLSFGLGGKDAAARILDRFNRR